MERNVGGYDRIARFVVGPLLVALVVAAFFGYVTIASGLFGAAILWAALLFGAVLIVTAATQMCPLNRMLGINTYRDRSEAAGSETEAESRDERPT